MNDGKQGSAAEIPNQNKTTQNKTTQKKTKKTHPKCFFGFFLDFKGNRYILYLIPCIISLPNKLFAFFSIQRLIFATILLTNKAFLIFISWKKKNHIKKRIILVAKLNLN